MINNEGPCNEYAWPVFTGVLVLSENPLNASSPFSNDKGIPLLHAIISRNKSDADCQFNNCPRAREFWPHLVTDICLHKVLQG